MGFEELQKMLATVSRAAFGARGAAELAEVLKRRGRRCGDIRTAWSHGKYSLFGHIGGFLGV